MLGTKGAHILKSAGVGTNQDVEKRDKVRATHRLSCENEETGQESEKKRENKGHSHTVRRRGGRVKNKSSHETK
jgi:hypothetical protein